ncbi:MAG: hypothetical protein AB1553_11655 [Nitrospirota bacterium]
MSDSQHPYQGPPHQAARHIEGLFQKYGGKLTRVAALAQKVREGVQRIDPFIQQHTSMVCPRCQAVCCLNKHAYYNDEDFIYIHALGLTPHDYEQRDDTEPCQFLSQEGCRLERTVRPSGCNWYFCDALYESMEKAGKAYDEFDDALRKLAELWMEMIDEFKRVTEHT